MANVKKTVRRKREKKNVPAGAVHIRSSFNNTMQQEVHSVRSPDGCRNRGKGRHGVWSEVR